MGALSSKPPTRKRTVRLIMHGGTWEAEPLKVRVWGVHISG